MCEGQVTVTDPGHPLLGRILKLAGFAVLPGHVRHCQVEIFHDQYAYVPVCSTNLSQEPRPEPTRLTATAIAELAAIFQAVTPARRSSHAKRKQSPRLGTTCPPANAPLSSKRSCASWSLLWAPTGGLLWAPDDSRGGAAFQWRCNSVPPKAQSGFFSRTM